MSVEPSKTPIITAEAVRLIDVVIKEIAVPLKGKKNNLTKSDFFSYFAHEKLGLNQTIIDGILKEFHDVIPKWRELIHLTFLSQPMKEEYLELLNERCERLNLMN